MILYSASSGMPAKYNRLTLTHCVNVLKFPYLVVYSGAMLEKELSHKGVLSALIGWRYVCDGGYVPRARLYSRPEP